ncbi:MAG: hypothetical protein K6G03_06480 [Lachnospiraceae bacterium]|nr:hypothetical protein [Lachnospiraceae bacterium]
MKLSGECLSLRYLGDAVNDRVVIMAYADDEGEEKYYIEINLNWEEPEENVFLAQVNSVYGATNISKTNVMMYGNGGYHF